MKMVSRRYLRYVFLEIILLQLLIGCNLENNIEIDLPEHEPQLVVECYLEPGKEARLLLTESSPYLDPPSLPIVTDALVTITYNEIIDTLKLNPRINPESKVYNYISNKVVPEDYENEFFLSVKDSKGRTITGRTKLLKPVQIQEMEYKFNKDSLAYILATFSDDLSQNNFYRFMAHKDSLTNVIQRFPLTDELSETSKISLGTPFIYKKGDLAFITLFHIDEGYYQYLQSVDAARDANFNPFAQPAMIKSNVEGGIGIFTGLVYDSKTLTIK